jgi:hypothetical protein
LATDRRLEKLEDLPSGVTAQAFVSFLQSELTREGHTAIAALGFFRIEN